MPPTPPAPLGPVTVKVTTITQKEGAPTVARLEVRYNGAALGPSSEVPLVGPLTVLKCGEEYDLVKKATP